MGRGDRWRDRCFTMAPKELTTRQYSWVGWPILCCLFTRPDQKHPLMKQQQKSYYCDNRSQPKLINVGGCKLVLCCKLPSCLRSSAGCTGLDLKSRGQVIEKGRGHCAVFSHDKLYSDSDTFKKRSWTYVSLCCKFSLLIIVGHGRLSGLDLESQECVYSVLWHKGLKDTAPLSGYKLSVCRKSLLINSTF